MPKLMPLHRWPKPTSLCSESRQCLSLLSPVPIMGRHPMRADDSGAGHPACCRCYGRPQSEGKRSRYLHLRDAGVDVEVGLLADKAYELNRRFLKSVTLRRPFITLKWARSKDGYMDWVRSDEHPLPCRFSTPLTSLSTMRLRALHDAVITTAATVRADNPRLTLRNFDGKQPVAVVLTHSNNCRKILSSPKAVGRSIRCTSGL